MVQTAVTQVIQSLVDLQILKRIATFWRVKIKLMLANSYFLCLTR